MDKKLVLIGLLATFSFSLAEEIKNPILRKLVEKGILTKEEAIEVERELAIEEKLKKEKSVNSSTEKKDLKSAKTEKSDNVELVSKVKKIKVGGVGYLGYTFIDRRNGRDEGDFEIRRGYFITKFYFNKKDYIRFTLDVTKHNHNDNANQGKEFNFKIKHLYLYKDISDFVPYTAFEFGLVHTPWLDYEEHSGWLLRSISKTFFEATDGAHLLPSADLGIDFKTKTKYISAEYGMFEGEGYDHIGRRDQGDKENMPMFDGRLTFHLFGNGNKHLKPLKDEYANISLHALDSIHHRGSKDDLVVYQLHAVYNQPLFLIAGQYIKSDWFKGSENDGDGYSFNFEFRPFLEHRLSFFGRYDHWDAKDNNLFDRNQYIYGLAWQMNKYIRWILNGITVNYDKNNSNDYNKYMLSAEVHF